MSLYLVESLDDVLMNKVGTVDLTAGIGQTNHRVRNTVAVVQSFVAKYFQVCKGVVNPSPKIINQMLENEAKLKIKD